MLGAGPGGYVAAIRAAQLGLKTAIIELKYWGGVCNNVGCIPTKSLLRNAEIAHIFNHEADVFGISGDVTFDFGAAWKRSRTAADRMAKGVHFLMKKNKITEIDGWATFTDDHAFSVDGPKGTETVTFDNVIIAAGATTRLLPGTSLSERVVTYEELIMTDSLPESIVIAGAGAIGVEFAYVMANYGVQVTLVEFLDRVVPLEEPDVSKELAQGVQETRRNGARRYQGGGHRRLRGQGQGHRLTDCRRREQCYRDRQGAAGDRVRTAYRGLRAGNRRRETQRSRCDRDRRLHAHQRAAHLRHRRLHRQAAARTQPRRREWSLPRPSPARRPCRSTTT